MRGEGDGQRSRIIMKKAFIVCMAMLLLGGGRSWAASPAPENGVPAVAAERRAVSPEKNADPVGAGGTYTNARYGFTVTWPRGDMAVAESDNGDGIVVTDSRRGLELRAWGGRGWSTLGMDLEAGIEETRGWFDTVFLKRVNSQEGSFILSGSAGDDMLHVKGFYTPDAVCLLSVRYARKDGDMLEAFAADVLRSFRRTTPLEPLPLENDAAFERDASQKHHAFVTIAVGNGRDEHGCVSFLLTAQKDVHLSFRRAVLEDDATVRPGDPLRRVVLKAGEACMLRTAVPEGVPDMFVCVGDACWSPAFSGKDGALLLSPGFATADGTEAAAAQVADVHLRSFDK